MNFTNKNIIAFFLLLFFLHLFFSCENKMSEVKALTTKLDLTEEGYNITSYLSLGGKLKAKLTAPFMTRSDKDSQMLEFPKSLQVIFYNDSTKEESYLFAKYGRHLGSKNLVFLKDSILFYNRAGDTLWTNELWWDQNKAQIYTDKRVKIKRSNEQVTIGANGMNSKQDMSDLQVFGVMPDSSFMTMPDSMMPGAP
jgi:LPS export ABC transporter protein LptC